MGGLMEKLGRDVPFSDFSQFDAQTAIAASERRREGHAMALPPALGIEVPLSRRQLNAILCRERYQMGIDEAAHQLGIKPRAFRRLYQRACEKRRLFTDAVMRCGGDARQLDEHFIEQARKSASSN
jgi:hypothetical protein